MKVVIVESPAKAKTINKYLGTDYKVLASFGHVRDLPEKDGSVDPDDGFAMRWEEHAESAKQLRAISDAVKQADGVVLATDPDREGEAISWHVLEVLRKKKALADKPVSRVVFNAITRNAVMEAMDNPRDIDTDLVDAYLARRALDYLVGFNLSPVLWRKLPGARSAGRVQSVALRLICAREIEIEAFKPREYWTLDTTFAMESGDTLTARLVRHQDEKLEKFSLADEAAAQAAQAAIEGTSFTIEQTESKPGKRHPAPPFTTSTLQQEASRKLGFNARRTMQTAQRLYEGVSIDGETTGLITYMRTDGVDIAPEAVSEGRDTIDHLFGAEHLPDVPRKYTSKAANAQEAHEAIRPTSFARHPDDVARLGGIGEDERRLYELVWKRALASQMESARVERTTIDIAGADGKTGLRATGTVITFAGFLKLYEEGRDDEADEKDGVRLPMVEEGAALDTREIAPEQHFTEPPPRYSEATLVKRMEALGIGRPSTYTSILSVLRDRDYVRMERNRFVPEDKGRLVVAFLENFFDRYVEYDFTAALENDLDKVSNGDLGYRDVLDRFWGDFHTAVETTLEIRNTQILDTMNDVLAAHIFKDADGGVSRACPKCDEGQLSLKTGRYGAFVGCTRYPDCRFTRPFATGDDAGEDIARVLGQDPESGLDVHVKDGRFGAYIQLGENGETEKPKRASIPKGKTPQDMTLEYALKLLSLPIEIGAHPESGEAILADIGRYGPYVRCGKQSASLETPDEVFEIGVNRAVAVLAERKRKGPRRGAAGGSVIKELGAHPESGKPVRVMDGRYGPYVKYEAVNATIPKDEEPDGLTLERGLELIAARIAKGGGRKRRASAKK